MAKLLMVAICAAFTDTYMEPIDTTALLFVYFGRQTRGSYTLAGHCLYDTSLRGNATTRAWYQMTTNLELSSTRICGLTCKI